MLCVLTIKGGERGERGEREERGERNKEKDAFETRQKGDISSLVEEILVAAV